MSSSSRSSDRSVLQFHSEVRSKSIQPPSNRIIGVGEMADLIRAFDWERTSLRGIETWSDTLVTTVNLILASRHPMFLWWGPDLIQFYNDGYRPSVRADKHPSALGQRGVECWAEVWPIIGPQIEAVMHKGESTWNTNQLVPINRDGKLEEVFWTYGYSPVRDQAGAVQGVLVVCTETTEQVLGELRVKAAQEQLRSANEELEKKIAERTAALEGEISDRKRAETSLRELTGHLLLAQDEERRHMARELHDHAGQTLVALGLNFAALLDAAKSQDPKMIDLITQSQQLSDDLSKEIRTLSYLLHPPLLDEAGLASAIRWYVEGFSKRSGIEVDLDLPEHSSRLPRALELVVFRVVQESLTNVHRHSGSPSASIRLNTSPQSIQVEITDRGKGISPERHQQLAAAKTGVGVRGMQERVRQFGGHLQIDSSPAGTKVSIVIPLVSQ